MTQHALNERVPSWGLFSTKLKVKNLRFNYQYKNYLFSTKLNFDLKISHFHQGVFDQYYLDYQRHKLRSND